MRIRRCGDDTRWSINRRSFLTCAFHSTSWMSTWPLTREKSPSCTRILYWRLSGTIWTACTPRADTPSPLTSEYIIFCAFNIYVMFLSSSVSSQQQTLTDHFLPTDSITETVILTEAYQNGSQTRKNEANQPPFPDILIPESVFLSSPEDPSRSLIVSEGETKDQIIQKEETVEVSMTAKNKHSSNNIVWKFDAIIQQAG